MLEYLFRKAWQLVLIRLKSLVKDSMCCQLLGCKMNVFTVYFTSQKLFGREGNGVTSATLQELTREML